jgi:hypothetical protein
MISAQQIVEHPLVKVGAKVQIIFENKRETMKKSRVEQEGCLIRFCVT